MISPTLISCSMMKTLQLTGLMPPAIGIDFAVYLSEQRRVKNKNICKTQGDNVEGPAIRHTAREWISEDISQAPETRISCGH
ncbi:unnamed protein product [Dracunculus medinensis]|uniref:Uncharacterized protein n=1 Tax=Dracunculus medinensis TaxID=318479 RepID=A0A0N4UCM8_DRAME|nr:unnamed protein product [Dracunculus medinensis]